MENQLIKFKLCSYEHCPRTKHHWCFKYNLWYFVSSVPWVVLLTLSLLQFFTHCLLLHIPYSCRLFEPSSLQVAALIHDIYRFGFTASRRIVSYAPDPGSYLTVLVRRLFATEARYEQCSGCCNINWEEKLKCWQKNIRFGQRGFLTSSSSPLPTITFLMNTKLQAYPLKAGIYRTFRPKLKEARFLPTDFL